jgi:hypothetical protein
MDYGERTRIKQHFKSISVDLVDVHIKRYMRNVTDVCERDIFLEQSYDVTIDKISELVPDSWEESRPEDTLLPFVIEDWYNKESQKRENWEDVGSIFSTKYEPSPQKISKVIREGLTKRSDSETVYGKFLRYAFKGVNLRSSMLSIMVYDQNELDILVGKVTPYKTQVVAFVPDLNSYSAPGSVTLVKLLDKMYESEVRTGSADILK